MSGHSYDTVEAALPDAERYCKRDGIAWIMRDKIGRFHIIYPYSKEIEKHYLEAAEWSISARLHTGVVVVSESAPTPPQAHAGEVVVHRCHYHASGLKGRWHDGSPDPTTLAIEADGGCRVELAYSHPTPASASVEAVKRACCDFYYWWHNQPGTNTEQGFDRWVALQGKPILAALDQQERGNE